MLFLTENDVKRALECHNTYREAVAVIEQVLRQQSEGSTFHLQRYTMTHPQYPGHLWHNIRILPTALRSRVFLSGSDQVLGDTPPRKPFDTLVASGKFRPEDVAAEFCDVVGEKKPGRRSAEEIILYESPGMGNLAAGIGHWVFNRAVKKGLGTELPFGKAEQ